MNPTVEQLARYVVQELERGVPEVTLYSAMRESGWTQEWIDAAFSTAKQRAMPVNEHQLTIPAVQHPPIVQPIHHHSMRPGRMAAPSQPRRQMFARPRVSSLAGTKKFLLILVAVLSVITVGLGIYRAIAGAQHASAQKVIRDADRREDLSVLLSNVSDYYVTHSSYPTRTQLNTQTFLETNGFSADSVTDPKWSAKDDACTREGRPMLAGVTTPNCYAYEVTAGKSGVCNNGTTPCTKVKVTILLEVDKQPYSVTFDKNTQVD
jgi:hypothetical protein